MTTIEEKSRILTIMTVLMMILVVVGHSTRIFTTQGAFAVVLPTNISGFKYLTDAIYSFHMPAFIAISGALFYLAKEDLGKYGNAHNYLKKRTLRLMIPYYCFLLLIVSPTLASVDLIPLDHLFGYIARNLIFIGDNRHLWYLPTLFGIQLLFYFGYKYVRRLPIGLTIFLVMYVVSFCYPTDFPIVNNILFYSVFFYSGFLMLKYLDYIPFVRNTCFLLICFLLIATYPVGLLSFYGDQLCYANIGILFSFGISWRMAKKTTRANKIITTLKKNSYGIYLFHPMIIYLAYFFLIKSNIEISPIILCALILVVSFFLSLLFTILLRRIGAGIFIGE